jgi:hypothetical protein
MNSKDLCTRFDHHDPDLVNDPFPAYETLRGKCPVVHSEEHGGFWALTRYEDVYQAAHDAASFSSAIGGITIPHMGADGAPPMIPIEVDPPMHIKYRQLTQRLFSPGYLAQWEEPTRRITTELLDKLIDKGSADFADDLAVPIPLTIISLMMGVPLEDSDKFKDWSVKLVQLHHESPEVQLETAQGLLGYFQDQAEDRRRHPEKDDLVSVLVKAEIDGRPLTDAEIQQYCFLLLLAGNETTTNAMGASLWYLAQQPELRDRLQREPSLIGPAVEEFLRFFSPVQGLARTTTCDVEVGGVTIPKGESVLLLWASANRDEAKFPEPNEFLAEREPNLHIAFGAGPHRCLGSNLARLELRVLLEEVLRRIPDYQVVGDVEWYTGATRGINRLPVTFTPAAMVD